MEALLCQYPIWGSDFPEMFGTRVARPSDLSRRSVAETETSRRTMFSTSSPEILRGFTFTALGDGNFLEWFYPLEFFADFFGGMMIVAADVSRLCPSRFSPKEDGADSRPLLRVMMSGIRASTGTRPATNSDRHREQARSGFKATCPGFFTGSCSQPNRCY